MSYQIGIDLGTTNSVVAFLEGIRPVVIPNAEGSNITPSVVLYKSGEEIIVGELAKRQIVTNPTRTIHSIKRFMGRRFNEIGDMNECFQYKLMEEADIGRVLVDLGWKRVSPEEVSAEILKKIRKDAEAYLGETVTQAVITVPAYFNDSQRSATKTAAELAGLDVLRIINEPTAAALAYGLNKDKVERLVVFDFGGGTFDISIMELDKNIFEVRSTNGDTFLGGNNIDQCIFDFIREEIKKETGLDLINDPQAVQRAKEGAEKVKCELSTMKSTTISLPFIVSDDEGPKHFSREFTREEFNRLTMPLLERLIPPCRNALMDAGMTPEDIDTVILVGGSSRIVKVQEMVSEFFNKEPMKVERPDEVVAMGAAIQAGVISGNLQEVLLLDVTPLSLGIELADDIFSVLIPRNSSIPTTATKKFTTVVDNQRTVYIHVLQGERQRASQNRSLAHFRLMEITPAPRDVPEIEVKFNIDANGILNVQSTDLTSGASNEIRVESYQTSIPKDYQREIQEAERKREEDRIYVEKIRRKERYQHTIDMIKKFISEVKDQLETGDYQGIMEIVSSADDAIKAGDFEAVGHWINTLYAVFDKYGQLYSKFRSIGRVEKDG
jgi:molecular chaperone DnaK